MLTLIPISIVLGVAMLWVFGRTSNQRAIQTAKRRLQACLYEMRLFADEPSLVWKAQIGLVTANARYLGLMLVPAAIVTIPMIAVFAHLEAFYGMAPLTPGRAALVTMQLSKLDPTAAPPTLTAPPQIAVETPPVRVLSDRQVWWRIRANSPVSGTLHFGTLEGVIDKKVEAGSGMHYLSDRRVRGLLDLVLHPAESRLPAGNIEWIEIRYPAATISWLGLEWHWLIWLLLFSMLSALCFRRYLRVTF